MNRPVLIAVVCLALVSLALAIIWSAQRRLMYFPIADLPDVGNLGLADIETVSFETSDGLRLSGWFVAAASRPRATVLVFNGNAGNRSHRIPLAMALRAHGFQVLLLDYRGYGGNPGVPTQKGLAADSRAARAFLAGRPDVDISRLVYFGESLGTAVAVDLAADYPPAALVLRSPFTSMADIGQHHYPFLPVRLLLRDRYAAVDQIRQVQAPMLIVAGERDRIVPIENTRRLYAAAPGPKKLIVLPAADHNDYDLLAGDEMIRAVVAFLNPLLQD